MEILGFDFPTWLLLLLLAIYLYIYYMSRQRGMFKAMGIAEVDVYPVIGPMLDFKKHGLHGSDMNWIKKHGKVFGYIDPLGACLVVADPDLLREILVKDFQNFPDRRIIEGLTGVLGEGVSNLKGEHWKFVRNFITPTFSTGKLRKMFCLIERASDTLIKTVERKLKSEKEIELKRLFGGYTMDVIASTAFGIEVDSQENPDDPFVKNAKTIMDTTFGSPVVVLYSFLPFLRPVMRWLGMCIFPLSALNFLSSMVKSVFKGRQEINESGKNYTDFIQLMIEAQEKGELSGIDFKKLSEKKGLTIDEIVGQALLFLVAGYDTTALLLSWTSYNLANNPDKQEILRKEIETKLDGKKIDYDSLGEIEFLDMCINESLRMFPPVVRFDRVCVQDTEVNGVKIKKGTAVNIPVYAIHHDPEIWENPEEFKPERFSLENKTKHGSCTFLPFGYGPRNCIGMRLAYAEAKMAIARIIQNYKISVGSKTTIPPKLLSFSGFLKPMELYLTLEKVK